MVETVVCLSLQLFGSRKMVFDQLEAHMREKWMNTISVTKLSKTRMEDTVKRKKAYLEKRMSKPVKEKLRTRSAQLVASIINNFFTASSKSSLSSQV